MLRRPTLLRLAGSCLCLLLTGIAALLIVNAGSVTRYLKENMQVSVLMHDGVTDDQARSFAASLDGRPYVHTARVITQEEGAEELKSMLGEDFLDVFETSPVPVSVDVGLNAEYVQTDTGLTRNLYSSFGSAKTSRRVGTPPLDAGPLSAAL